MRYDIDDEYAADLLELEQLTKELDQLRRQFEAAQDQVTPRDVTGDTQKMVSAYEVEARRNQFPQDEKEERPVIGKDIYSDYAEYTMIPDPDDDAHVVSGNES